MSTEAAAAPARTGINKQRMWRIASLVIVLVLWEMVGRGNPVFLSYPSAVVVAAWEVLFVDRELPRAIGVTAWGFAIGYVTAVIVGATLGFLMSQSRAIDIILGPYARAFYTLPRIALIPLLVLVAGIGFRLRISIVFLSAVFSVIIIVRDGGLAVAKAYRELAQSFVASRWQTWRTVVLPGSLPYLFSALRVGAQRALIGIIVAETLAALSGTGRLIADYAKFFQTDKLLVPVLLIGFASIMMTAGLNALERAVTPHKRAVLGKGRG